MSLPEESPDDISGCLHVGDHVLGRDLVQEAEGVEHVRHLYLKSRDDECTGALDNADETADDHGGGAVDVHGAGHIDHDDLIAVNVGEKDPTELSGSSHGDAVGEPYEAGTSIEGVGQVSGF